MSEETKLTWNFAGRGEWVAYSRQPQTDSSSFAYRIQVCSNGTFDPGFSEEELGMNESPISDSLDGAKACCELNEERLAKARNTGAER